MNKRNILALVILTCLSISCKKNHNSTPACGTTPYAYSGTFDITGAYSPQKLGIIDLTSGLVGATVSFVSSSYANQGAYDPVHNYYYVFRYYNSGLTGTLYKIDLTANTVTPLTYAGGPSADFEALVYNRFNSKLYSYYGNNISHYNYVFYRIFGSYRWLQYRCLPGFCNCR